MVSPAQSINFTDFSRVAQGLTTDPMHFGAMGLAMPHGLSCLAPSPTNFISVDSFGNCQIVPQKSELTRFVDQSHELLAGLDLRTSLLPRAQRLGLSGGYFKRALGIKDTALQNTRPFSSFFLNGAAQQIPHWSQRLIAGNTTRLTQFSAKTFAGVSEAKDQKKITQTRPQAKSVKQGPAFKLVRRVVSPSLQKTRGLNRSRLKGQLKSIKPAIHSVDTKSSVTDLPSKVVAISSFRDVGNVEDFSGVNVVGMSDSRLDTQPGIGFEPVVIGKDLLTNPETLSSALVSLAQLRAVQNSAPGLRPQQDQGASPLQVVINNVLIPQVSKTPSSESKALYQLGVFVRNAKASVADHEILPLAEVFRVLRVETEFNDFITQAFAFSFNNTISLKEFVRFVAQTVFERPFKDPLKAPKIPRPQERFDDTLIRGVWPFLERESRLDSAEELDASAGKVAAPDRGETDPDGGSSDQETYGGEEG